MKSIVRRSAKAGQVIQEPMEVHDHVREKLKKYKFLFVSSDIGREIRIREMHRIMTNNNTLVLYELSTDSLVCCTLTYEERFHAGETEIVDWVAAIYDEIEQEDLQIQFLMKDGDRSVTFTRSNFEQHTTCVPFCRVVTKVTTPTTETSRRRGSRTY